MKNKTAFASALRALDRGPRRIMQARKEFAAEAERINTPEHKRTFSEVYREKELADAREKMRSAIDREVSNMKSSLAVVRENRTFNDGLDVSNQQLQNAVTIINTMGHNLSPSAQLDIAQSFRGDIGSLTILSQIYRKYGLYYADEVAKMTTPVSEQAIADMQYVCDKWNAGLGWDDASDGKLYWTQHEFGDAMARYGFDTDGDPYEAALESLRREYGQSPDARIAAAGALKELKAGELSESEKRELFDRTVNTINAQAKDRHDKELKWEMAQHEARK